MISRRRVGPPAVAAGLLLLCLSLQGCLATTVAGATLGVAGAAAKTTVKVTNKVVGGAVHLTGRAARKALKGPAPAQ
ncbi:MAG TPA: hypothetical protein VGI95_15145 [Caulobacteraceae bacterium]|jgi:hypothetical protein